MHGTGGTGGQFTGASFAGQLFGAAQPLDATKHCIILPDAIGHGGSSKPSNGLRAKFPRYGCVDMPRGKAIVLPLSDRTTGHGTHTQAAVWKQYLEELLRKTER
jgi:homoserine acetyltransferase